MGTASLARPDHNSDFFYIIIKFHRVGYLSSLNTSMQGSNFGHPLEKSEKYTLVVVRMCQELIREEVRNIKE